MKNEITPNNNITGRIIAGATVLVLALGAITWLVFANKTPNTASTGKIKIVASANFWGDIARQVGGDRVTVESIITSPDADPHLYESNANNAAAVNTAAIAIVNGAGYDEFMAKLLSGSKNDTRAVIDVAAIMGAPNTANPHFWYNLPKIQQVAIQLKDALVAKDAAHAKEYEANLVTFISELQPLLATVTDIKNTHAGAPVAYTEPVAGYLLEAAALANKTPEGFAKAIEEGVDPSPADIVALTGLITGKHIKVLLYNPQAISPTTEQILTLAQQNGVPVVAMRETLPANSGNYQQWQQSQLDELKRALQTSS